MKRSRRFAAAAALAAAMGGGGLLTPAAALDASALKDGTWSGPRVPTFYGYVQLEAVVRGGVLTDVKVHEVPAHDGTSRRINALAVPYLVKSAVANGGAGVDTISGATVTSKAFAKSLEGALGASR